MKERAYEIAIYPKYDGYQRGLASMVYTLFDKKAGVGTSVIEELFLKLYKKEFLKGRESFWIFLKGEFLRGLKIIFGQQI